MMIAHLLLLTLSVLNPRSESAAPVSVILWFDTEDYLLPADDDATLRLARWLTKEKVHATFKVVGEKARVLEQRGRRDVIAALKQHEIGFHSDLHSVHPTPAEYMSALGWDEGTAEFLRRETPGVASIRRIFGVSPSCYGQPGSSWAPQAYAAIRKLGMNVYLDSATHVRLDGKPFFYGGVLTLIELQHTLRTKLSAPRELEEAKTAFRSAYDDLTAQGGGLISVFYHPNEFVHREFWDAVNFREGANPPRAGWIPPRVKAPADSHTAFENFEGYIRFMKTLPGLRFVTASEAARLYRDRAQGRTFTKAEVREVAATVMAQGPGFQVRGDHALAASEVLALLTRAFLGERLVLQGTPFGPSEPPRSLGPVASTTASQFDRTTADVADYLARHGRVPSTIWLGSAAVSPEVYLRALAQAVSLKLDGQPLLEVALSSAELTAAVRVADDDPRKLWGWVIFPRGFRAPEMMALARRQAWTLKPAPLVP